MPRPEPLNFSWADQTQLFAMFEQMLVKSASERERVTKKEGCCLRLRFAIRMFHVKHPLGRSGNDRVTVSAFALGF